MYLRALLFAALPLIAGSQAQSSCDCGFYDPSTGNVFTEYMIVYFNETSTVPTDTFQVQSFSDPYEKSWNALYRTGANKSNVNITQTPSSPYWQANQSLALSVDPATAHHFVTGGSIRSLRADLQYGSFRTLMKPASNYSDGIAMSMFLQFNETQNIHMSATNQESPVAPARFVMTTGDEFPDIALGLNFTSITNDTNNATLTAMYAGLSPYDFTELRIDWNKKNVSYYIGNVLSRVATEEYTNYKGFPSTPSELILRAWSDGDTYYMGGPPRFNRVTGYIGYTRAFFNSSIMTKEEHNAFDARCSLASACSMDDSSLRGYSAFTHASTISYKWHHSPSVVYTFAVAIIIASVAITCFLACNIIYQRWPTKASKQPKLEKDKYCRRLPPQIAAASGYSSGAATLASAAMTPVNLTRPPSLEGKDIDDMRITEVGPSRFGSSATLNMMGHLKHTSSSTHMSEAPTRVASSTTLNTLPPPRYNSQLSFSFPPTKEEEKKENVDNTNITEKEVPNRPTGPVHAVTTTSLAQPYKPLAPRQRIDFLAGLISLVTIFVTLEHFTFTFTPAVSMPGAPAHYNSENWANKIIGTFIFNQIYLGVFFITSTRFLIMKYLKTGKLESIAEKVTTRVFRVWVPIAAAAGLQYFLIDCGATQWLMYLPSVTWSSWPYAVAYTDFANYISELIELVYLLPNATPQISYNYCTGVLWTIPVQIDGSWTSLAGAVLVMEIKNPWKRGAFYTFCVINGWYAQNWAPFFWMGVALTDLDITFDYKTWFKSHKLVYYCIMTISVIMALGGIMQDGITGWTDDKFSLPVLDNGIHPDIMTGLTIDAAGHGGYPDYTVPRANGLIFAIGLQFVVENCHWVQMCLSIKPFLLLFPHIFTVYLFHGLIFWSLGAVICTHLAPVLPYWATILVVGLACYGLLFASLPLLTPIVETLGKDVTANIWSWAHVEPAPKQRTLFPFREDLFFEQKRVERDSIAEADEEGGDVDLEKKGRGIGVSEKSSF